MGLPDLSDTARPWHFVANAALWVKSLGWYSKWSQFAASLQLVRARQVLIQAWSVTHTHHLASVDDQAGQEGGALAGNIGNHRTSPEERFWIGRVQQSLHNQRTLAFTHRVLQGAVEALQSQESSVLAEQALNLSIARALITRAEIRALQRQAGTTQ